MTTQRQRGKRSRPSALAQAQGWLVGAIAAEQPPTVIDRQLGGAAVSASVGLGIYRHAYRARLEECLADDFPALRSLLGEHAFSRLAAAVIRTHPPSDATLNTYGRWLLRYVHQQRASLAHGRLAYDLARLEWALLLAIHAPLAPKPDFSVLQTLAPARWSALRLVPVPSLRLVTSRWPIDVCYRQHLRGETVSVPTPLAGTVAVLRHAEGLERQVFAPGPARLLRRLMRGQPLGRALVGTQLSPESVQQALSSFITAGCIAHIIIPSRKRP